MNRTLIVATLAAVLVGGVLGYFVVSSAGITSTSETARMKNIQDNK